MDKIIKLAIPEVLRSDKYWDSISLAIEEMLEEYYVTIQIGDKSILDSSKDELLIRAESLGIGTIFKRIPIERGRQLINEFNYMVKSKGSEEAIKRMIQIYLGVVNCELFYTSSTREYTARLVYGELAGTNSSLVDTVYDAVRYVNPVGRLMRELNLIIEPIIISISRSQTITSLQRYRTIYGSDTQDLIRTENVGYFRRNFKVYPKMVNRNQYSSIFPYTSGGINNTETLVMSVHKLEDLDNTDLAYFEDVLESRVDTSLMVSAIRSGDDEGTTLSIVEGFIGKKTKKLRRMEVI